jgi:starch synthase (maltosyl-transferring)
MSPGAPDRIVVADLTPLVDGGRFPVKRVEGEPVVVGATVFADGHDVLHVRLSHQSPGSRTWTDVEMGWENPGLDRWRGVFTPLDRGLHRFRVLAWIDELASWADGTRRKLEAGLDVDAELLEGASLIELAAAGAPRSDRALLEAAAERMRAGETTDLTDTGSDRRPSVATLWRRRLRRADAVASATVDVLVERERAQFSSWYELFPRSQLIGAGRPDSGGGGADGPVPHGTLRQVIENLDYVADLGFDVLYLPPIHPIGEAYRKGPNNAPVAGADDVGSPWAIGAATGGHTSVHPRLGTVDDVRDLLVAAAESGIDIALDLAFQCSPDHPWVTEHPEWFRHRPDGSIQYAENPPKKYQDIYPFDFGCEEWSSLWEALLAATRFWLDLGVRVFRVDNPHTKPFAFWEWFIAELRRVDPDVIFLAEAFTRPRVMHELAKRGFTQGYSYFTWRVSKAELTEFGVEISTGAGADHFRANLWPNTPDILPWHLQGAGPEVFAVRHLLAATLGASYGIYGPAFELGDNRAMGNGKEEYLDSEKYQLRRWDLDQPGSLREQITRVNAIRRQQLALHTTRTLRFHGVGNEQLLAYSKTTHDGADPDPARPTRNPVLAVVNLDPGAPQRATLDLDLAALGIDPSRAYDAHDLLTDRRFEWEGSRPYIELHPDRQPGHLFRISQPLLAGSR